MKQDRFWSILRGTLHYEAPVYAIDNEKSLFPDSCLGWNLNKTTLKESIIHTPPKIPGINTPYLNFGMRYTSFEIHCEDSNLGSINKLHFGGAKMWYAVPESHAEQLEKLIQKNKMPGDTCDLIIRHKNSLVPPSELITNNIPFGKVKIFYYIFR